MNILIKTLHDGFTTYYNTDSQEFEIWQGNKRICAGATEKEALRAYILDCNEFAFPFDAIYLSYEMDARLDEECFFDKVSVVGFSPSERDQIIIEINPNNRLSVRYWDWKGGMDGNPVHFLYEMTEHNAQILKKIKSVHAKLCNLRWKLEKPIDENRFKELIRQKTLRKVAAV